jgi:uncharacterized protein with HEPN domain
MPPEPELTQDLDRLDDILAATEDIATFLNELDFGAFDSFVQNKAVRYAILHGLTIIGEAAGRVSEPVKGKYPHLPWRRIIAFRHRVVHGYGELDLELVWRVATELVPQLKLEIAEVRRGIGGQGVPATG